MAPYLMAQRELRSNELVVLSLVRMDTGQLLLV